MKKNIFGIATMVVMFFAQTTTAQTSHPFNVGEVLSYDVYFNWGALWVKAAQADMKVTNSPHDADAITMSLAAKTVKAFKAFDVRDTLVGVLDNETLNSKIFEQHAHENKYNANFILSFSNECKSVRLNKFNDEGKLRKDTTWTSAKPYYDILSHIAKLRTIDMTHLKMNERVEMPIAFSDGLYDLYWHYAGKETITLKNGKTYKCFKIKPHVADGNLFAKGDVMTVWFTDDKNCIPVMVECKLKVGSVKAFVTDMRNIKHPFSSFVPDPKKK